MNKILRLLVSIVLLGLIGWKTDWAQVATAFANLRVAWWLAALAILVAAQFASIVRWQLYARAIGLDAGFRPLAGFYFIGMFFNMVLPTSVGGDVVRAWYLTRLSGNKALPILSVLIDRVNGLIVLLLLACTAVAFSPIALPAWIALFAYGCAVAAGLGVLWIMYQPPEMLPVKLARKLQSVQAMVPVLRAPALNAATAALSLIVQLANVVLVWMIGRALRLDVPLFYFAVLVPLVSLLTLLPISLNGMGLREWGTVLFLAPLGIDAGHAVPLAFLWFAVYAFVSLLSGLVFALGNFPKPVLEQSGVENSGHEQPALEHVEVSQHGSVDCHSDQGRAGQHQQAA